MRLPYPVELTVAGRTDAGVHARGQVAHVDLAEEVWAEHGGKLLRRLAGRLPHDVRVWRVSQAPPHFNARFSAIWRRYAYRVGDHRGGVDPLRRGHVLWHDRPVDVDLMNEAAARLLGEHDFAAYCKKREGATTIRTLLDLHWERPGPGRRTPGWRWRPCGRTPSATTWCVRWWGPCCWSATGTARWASRPRSWRGGSGTRRSTSCGRTG